MFNKWQNAITTDFVQIVILYYKLFYPYKLVIEIYYVSIVQCV